MIKKLEVNGLQFHEAERLVSNKINELVEVVNKLDILVTTLFERSDDSNKAFFGLNDKVKKLESHKHEIDNWNEDYHCPIPTSEPVWMPNIEKDFEKLNIHNCDGSNNQPDKLHYMVKLEGEISNLQQVIDQERAVMKKCYEMASKWQQLSENSMVGRLNKIELLLKPYIEEK